MPSPHLIRPLRAAMVAAASVLLLGSALHTAADPFPAATEPLRDFDGNGFIQVDLPATPGNVGGVQLMIGYRQQFVKPDRTMIDVEVSGVRQRTWVQGNVERSFTPNSGYIVQRTYRNTEGLQEDPIAARRMSIWAFAQALREIQSAKVLPSEPLEQTEKTARARLEELVALRKLLAESKDSKDLGRAQDAAMESARTRDLIEQIPLFKSYPCWVVEVPNKELSQTLLAKGLMGGDARQLLDGGKSLVWVTKGQGLPVRMETRTSQGHVAVYFCFRNLRMNEGMQPGEVTLGAPLNWRQIAAEADVRQPNWQERMNQDLQKQVERFIRDVQDSQKAEREAFSRQPTEIKLPGKRPKSSKK